jgi:tetratricopeptide (TPR) repeat protein
MKRLSAILLLLLLAAAPAAAVDPFYQGLLRDGQYAFDRKDYPRAARDLRLACFGMLEEPKPLVDCLARLALAQDRAENVEDFRETFQRLVELEERFKAYSQGDLTPELRAALESRVAARVPEATLNTAPAFRSTLPANSKAAAVTPPREKPASQKPVGPEKTDKTPEPKPSTAPVPVAAVPPAPKPAQAVAQPPEPEALTDADFKKLDQARRTLAEQRPAKDLKDAFELARGVADAHPGFKEAQHLAAEGAYRISRWSDAAAYFRRGGDPGEEAPERLFYMAVSLYELGDATGAATVLKRALPNLKRTPYVDSYTRKILGS